ncbi:efflux RND transporter periplasmic adaptor subunit [Pedobacter sp. HMF7647]|uniref:Efflux RND transporter periplasmic adaptor subunit n=1 Tax=Hufsiella arboris TaxID=2695275 RepID=A0A7K1YAR6_9SPHI|nr:efflux RND transporter periplasmic adaptor subunit [Hufsiella arboris]MXV51199.1 efflux RND transporter periplasmic adaptor subunit [Hufsiella arboris]
MKRSFYPLIFIFLAACGGKKDKQTELADLKKQQAEIAQKIAVLESQTGKQDSTDSKADVSVVSIEPSTFKNYVEVQGTIDAEDNVTPNAEAGGVITAIYVHPGQQVSKGQVLVQLDNKTVQQQIAQAQAQVELTNSLYDRQKNLWDQKIGTEVQFIQAKTNRDVAQKQMSTLRAQSNMYRIVSPISGTVDQMDLKLGQVIQPGSQGIRIVNLSRLKVKANIAESYAGTIKQGDHVLISIPDAADSVDAVVTYASKVIDPTSRSFNVEVKLPSKNTLKPNMTAVLKIVSYNKPNALVVPLKAIQKTPDGSFIYLADNNAAKRIAVKTGNIYGGQQEILAGIKAGDKVITEGAQNLEDGDPVTIVN